MKSCSVEGCTRPFLAKGLCNLHYRRQYTRGNLGGLDVERVRGRRCSVAGCDKKHVARGLCSMHRSRLHHTGAIGPADSIRKEGTGLGSITKAGYKVLTGRKYADHPNAYSKGRGPRTYIVEHVLVMSQILGRPLRKGESVHHKNGVRHDNRPDNLELWVTTQPSGQRVTDRIADAVWLLSVYSSDSSQWPDELKRIQPLLQSHLADDESSAYDA